MSVPTGWETAGWMVIMTAGGGFGWIMGKAFAAKLIELAGKRKG